MNGDDHSYYLNRALQEDEAARIALSLPARSRHEELASLYRLKAQQLARTTDGTMAGTPVTTLIIAAPPPEIDVA